MWVLIVTPNAKISGQYFSPLGIVAAWNHERREEIWVVAVRACA